MSVWWEDDAQKYRSSLVYKVFYVWGWPVARWVMFNRMEAERAHTFAVRWAIPTIGLIDRVWSYCVLAVVLPVIVVLRLIAFLPGFSWDAADSSTGSAGE